MQQAMYFKDNKSTCIVSIEDINYNDFKIFNFRHGNEQFDNNEDFDDIEDYDENGILKCMIL
jgi:hypothetical protein